MKKKELKEADQKKQEEELNKYRELEMRSERKKDLIDSVAVILKPIEDKIDHLNNKLDAVEDGTLSTLRNDILSCYYGCVEKGYRNDYDYQNIHHMYQSYIGLHGNSYVEDIMKRFDDLPTKEERHSKEAR